MKRAVTLKENYEFRRLYQKGASRRGRRDGALLPENRLGHNRLGVTVSVKLGHAVVRNRPAAACGRSTGSIPDGSARGTT